MQIKVNKREKSQVNLEVEVPVETVREVFFQAFKKVAQEVEVPGFRKGKVPRKIFEQKFGKEAIRDEAFKQLYLRIYKKILQEEKINPLTHPEVELVKFSEDEPAFIKLEIATEPPIKLGTYKGIKVKREKVKVDEKEVEEQLKGLQRKNAEYPPLLENRPTQEGDWLSLEVRSLSPEVSFGRTNQENLWYKLGSDQLPPSFHQELLGAKIGDEKVVDTVVPPEHPQKAIAGKKLSFNVKVKDIRKEKLPPLDDEFAKKLNFENIKQLKDEIRKELEKFKERKEEERIRREILGKVIKNSQVEIPPLLVERGVEERMAELIEELRKKGLTLQNYLQEQKINEEKLKQILQTQIENELKLFFILNEIAQRENINVTEEELDKRLELFFKGKDKEIKARKLKKELSEKGRLNTLVQRIRNEKVIDFLYQQAEISEGILSAIKNIKDK